MIYIVTGKRNSGKTTYIKKMIENNKTLDGVISVKCFLEGIFQGYDLYHIQTGRQYPFLRLAANGGNDPNALTVGQFAFRAEGIAFGKHLLQEAFSKDGDVVIDEIAQMELRGGVFYEDVKQAVALHDKRDGQIKNLYLVVREELVKEVIQQFDITAYEVIDVENDGG